MEYWAPPPPPAPPSALVVVVYAGRVWWCREVWPTPENVLRLILHADTAQVNTEPVSYFLHSSGFVAKEEEGGEGNAL